MKRNPEEQKVADLVQQHLGPVPPVPESDRQRLLALLMETEDGSLNHCRRLCRQHGLALSDRQIQPIRRAAIFAWMRRRSERRRGDDHSHEG